MSSNREVVHRCASFTLNLPSRKKPRSLPPDEEERLFSHVARRGEMDRFTRGRLTPRLHVYLDTPRGSFTRERRHG